MPIITCPNCKTPLLQVEKTMRCDNGHAFDLAKQGYINLLLANKKKNNNPGDNREMIEAREAFLSAGHFNFLLDGILSTISSLGIFLNDEKIDLLDVGCGSGYYTRNLFREEKVNRVGLDISKIGIAKAAVKDKASTYIVGSAFDLPIADTSVDLLVNIFSPLDLEEVERVLNPGGYLIKVVPIGDHMREVAELVYDKFVSHTSSIKEDIETMQSLEVVKVEHLSKNITLRDQELLNFISMTPYLYKFTKAQLETLHELSITISFELIIAKYAA